MSFFTTNNNTVVISNLAPPARNSISRFDANYLMLCLFGDTCTSSFRMFSSAVLLLHNQTRSVCVMPITFFERGDLERARHSLATWQDSRWRRIFARSFLFQNDSFDTDKGCRCIRILKTAGSATINMHEACCHATSDHAINFCINRSTNTRETLTGF